MTVMIGIIVDKVRMINVKGIGEMQFLRKKMCSSSDAIEMDDRKSAASTDAAFKLGHYNPHSGILIYLSVLRNKPFNQGAWIACTTRVNHGKPAPAPRKTRTLTAGRGFPALTGAGIHTGIRGFGGFPHCKESRVGVAG
ncbi:hypothetical protein V8E52_005964 [Russula decolorans]